MYPTVVEERSTTSNLVLRLNDDITLNLEKSEVLAESLIFVTATREGHEIETVSKETVTVSCMFMKALGDAEKLLLVIENEYAENKC